MNLPRDWKYVNKGLLIILSAFTLATIASVVYLGHTLIGLNNLITESGQSSRSARLLQGVLIGLEEAETGARGYVITGDSKFLEPYNGAVKTVPSNIQMLSQTSGVVITANELTQLKNTADSQMRILKQIVDAKAAGNNEIATDPALNGQNKQLMDDQRTLISQVVDRSLNTARPQYALAHSRVKLALSVAVALSVFIVGICAVIAWYFQRSLLRERALENTKSEFLSLASHQLRTPATNVKQYIGLLLDGYLGDLTLKQQDALQVANKNNELEIRIMNDLLDVAKLDLKRIQLRKKRTNIVRMVREVAREYEPHAGVKGQKIDLKVPDEVIASVDKVYLKGVVEKLIDNAVRYSRDKTRISVRIHVDDTLGVFEIVVRDQGLGIHKREVPKLFMKFSRLANEFSANSEGSGMGLYWVKQIMALHGGSVEVKSAEGKGSKFTIRAPLS